jgi:uncharacterized membrane protein YdfJ with MMPL/SSD domain
MQRRLDEELPRAVQQVDAQARAWRELAGRTPEHEVLAAAAGVALTVVGSSPHSAMSAANVSEPLLRGSMSMTQTSEAPHATPRL